MELTDLPLELYQLILEFLNLPDVVNLRRVSKFFRDVVQKYRAYELGFYHFPEGTVSELLEKYIQYASIDNFSPTNLILYKRQHLLKQPLSKIETLKKLHVVCSAGPHDIDDSHLNRLDQLEELRVLVCFEPSDTGKHRQALNWKSSFPNLKVFDG